MKEITPRGRETSIKNFPTGLEVNTPREGEFAILRKVGMDLLQLFHKKGEYAEFHKRSPEKVEEELRRIAQKLNIPEIDLEKLRFYLFGLRDGIHMANDSPIFWGHVTASGEKVTDDSLYVTEDLIEAVFSSVDKLVKKRKTKKKHP